YRWPAASVAPVGTAGWHRRRYRAGTGPGPAPGLLRAQTPDGHCVAAGTPASHLRTGSAPAGNRVAGTASAIHSPLRTARCSVCQWSFVVAEPAPAADAGGAASAGKPRWLPSATGPESAPPITTSRERAEMRSPVAAE